MLTHKATERANGNLPSLPYKIATALFFFAYFHTFLLPLPYPLPSSRVCSPAAAMATFSHTLLYLALFSFSAILLLSDGEGAGQELWCIAKNNADDVALQAAVDWACNQGGANCQPILQGGSCFEPNDVQSHASYAFNDYFLKNGMTAQSCDFGHTAAITSVNPSHNSCVFPSSTVARNGSFLGSAPPAVPAAFGPVGPDLSGRCKSCSWLESLAFALLVVIASWIVP